MDCVSWEQAWELLKKMAANPECLDSIVNSLSKFATQMENTSSSIDRDMFDSHMGGLLHKMIHTAIEDYESSTPTYKRQKRLHLVWLLGQIAVFCYSFLQKSGTSRQFSALSTLNKIIDAGLVHDLCSFNDVVFHSSRILNRSHDFDSNDDAPSPCESFASNCDQNSTVDHVFVYGASYKAGDQSPSPTRAPPIRHKTDLMNAFSEMDPSQGWFAFSSTPNTHNIVHRDFSDRIPAQRNNDAEPRGRCQASMQPCPQMETVLFPLHSDTHR